MTLTQQQRDLIFGTLLGDANLQTFSNGRTWRYRALHKSEHQVYLLHKYAVLETLCGPETKPSESATLDSRTNKTYKRWSFNTLVHPSLKFYANMFYTYEPNTKKWVKNVPLNVEKFLTPAALAYLYMDDGSLKWKGKSNAMRICTESFSAEDVKRLQNALKNKYGIVTTTVNKAPGKRITIPEKSSEAFRKLIQPHLVECMMYKVSDGNKGCLGC